MWRNILWSAAVAGSVGVLGFASACANSSSGSGGDVCSSNGNCPNDATPSQSSIDMCNSIVDGSCGSQYTSLVNCYLANATCDSAGKSQVPSSACTSESNAYAQCAANSGGDGGSNPDAGSNADGGGTGNPTNCQELCGKIPSGGTCESSSTCLSACENPQGLPSSCQADYDAFVQCGATTGTITTCESDGTPDLTGCDTESSTLTTCIEGSSDSGVTSGGSLCPDIITCINACTSGDTTCEQNCYNAGTSTAQADFGAIETCLFGTDGMSGQCGAMCGTETTACDNCISAAQMSGGACYSQVQDCANDTTSTKAPLRIRSLLGSR